MSKVKRIPIKEFRALGFIQEINRRFLHPCGLALEVVVDQETGEETLGGVWDYRDDPEGMVFAEGVIAVDKVRTVNEILKSKEDIRLRELGYVIQPVPVEEGL
jgi:hypothetical protein